jgi:branched-chain amino acid transport system substrate-binding protein
MKAHVPVPRRRRRTVVALLAALAAMSGVAACGDEGGDTAGGGATASTASPESATTAGDTTAGSAVTDYLKYTGGTKGGADPSKEKIFIGWVNQQGGPADIGPRATDGAQLAVKYVNEELGGVQGHPLELVTCYISTAEEQGQTCGQKLANDKRVDVVAVGGVSLGAHSLMSTIDAAKPMVYSVAAGPPDATNKNGYILFGDIIRVLPPMGTFAQQVLHTKTAGVIYPEAPGVSFAADALTSGYEAAGLEVKRVSFQPNATDLLGPLTAAGAQSADVVTPLVLPPQCVNAARSLEQADIKAPIVATPLCLNADVAKALGDLPQWYYGIASSLAADKTDPAAGALMGVVQKYGDVEKVGDPYYPISFAAILTIDKWMNEIGADKLSPESIAAQAKAFKGPLAFGPPTLQCGKYPDAPAICNDQMKVFKYEGKGVFKPASGWLGPPS